MSQRPAKLVGRTLRKVPLDMDIIRVDDSGIYINHWYGLQLAQLTALEKYSHEFKLITRHVYRSAHSITLVDDSAPGLTCATKSYIYAGQEGKLLLKYAAEPFTISGYVYHPVRDSYFAAYNTRIVELDTKFAEIRQIIGSIRTLRMLPSANSTLLYTAKQAGGSIQFGVIGDSHTSLTRTLDHRKDTCHTMTFRPGHPESLTLFCNHGIDALDMWHTGATTWHATYSDAQSMHGAHLDSNVCMLTDCHLLRAVDFRCGAAWSRYNKDLVLDDIWYANSRIYVNGWLNLFILD